ncbi:hypothetical protein MCUN1_002268 [Malassezia cuniculi]|uniref:Arginine biosynthesis bifunctional protein ArgJ, mitochondrial n=1 Tax=Malassezia cuniculi TaxID=948313 RepID=A0AAF0J778_9BASI|nr:hypothetical protein MCUN1_002268 [Malassezia cuniculi]
MRAATIRLVQANTANKASRFVARIDAASLPAGFAVASTNAGIKQAISPTPIPPSSKPDLALISSVVPASVAGTFTTNAFRAAPVEHSLDILRRSAAPRAEGVLVNSGCANAVTGEQGIKNTQLLVDSAKELLGRSGDLLMLSTGVIGVQLPSQAMLSALPKLVPGSNTPEAWSEVARAFMTTDTFPKLRARSFLLGNRECKIAAISKGAGMIHPHMTSPGLHATMLGIFATDAPIAPKALQECLDAAVRVSFNCISVDGDMSTNDTVLALANGQAKTVDGGEIIAPGTEINETNHPALLDRFREELTSLCLEMAHLIVRDGEGATKFIEVRVRGAPTFDAARTIGASISTSALVKTALHGADANWGRILCAAGYASTPNDWQIDPMRVSVSFSSSAGSLTALVDGTPQQVDEDLAAKILAEEDIVLDIDLRGGTRATGPVT